MTVLITGLGYIGGKLADDLLGQDERVIAIENFFCTPRSAVARLARQRGMTLIPGSINRADTLREAFAHGRVRAVVHLAAQPSAHPQAASARYTELTNLGGTRLTLEAALQAGVERVILGSSFKVYGDQLPSLVGENQPYGRVGDLAHLSKIYTEKLAEMMAATRGPRCVAVRLGITHGLAPIMKTDPRFMTVPNRFCQLAAEGKPLTIHSTATQPAGFIHIQDASSALQAALVASWPEPYQAVNAVGECASVGQVAGLVRGAAESRGLSCEVSGTQSGHSRQITVETSLPTDLFQPRRRLSESVGEVLDYFIATARRRTARKRRL